MKQKHLKECHGATILIKFNNELAEINTMLLAP